MRPFIFCLSVLGLAPFASFALTCPPPLEYAEKRAAILETLRSTRDASAGRLLSRELLALLATAPNMRAQAILDEGMARRQSGDLRGAAARFSELIAYCPNYAEGYNQRAFVKYLQRNFSGAIADLNTALEYAPEHPGARAGKAMALMQIGRIEEGRAELRRALEVNPWLPERRMLESPPGQDV